jgi:hypothetical protein
MTLFKVLEMHAANGATNDVEVIEPNSGRQFAFVCGHAAGSEDEVLPPAGADSDILTTPALHQPPQTEVETHVPAAPISASENSVLVELAAAAES